ncbi:MAG: hypothetical protein M5R36_12435 [Deltaproteobacteria bacterium]|nr:hypothetical protein [Deltaproteobacteria bacterium]
MRVDGVAGRFLPIVCVLAIDLVAALSFSCVGEDDDDESADESPPDDDGADDDAIDDNDGDDSGDDDTHDDDTSDDDGADDDLNDDSGDDDTQDDDTHDDDTSDDDSSDDDADDDTSECEGCLLDAVCYPVGALRPGHPCKKCAGGPGDYGWQALSGTSCDDGIFCNGVDTCDEGFCVHAGAACDDGAFCNGYETCDEDVDACLPPPGNPCPVPPECREDRDDCGPIGDSERIEGGAVGYGTAIDFAPDGTEMIANAWAGDLYLYSAPAADAFWTEEMVFAYGDYPHLRIDESGVRHLLFEDTYTHETVYANDASGDWAFEHIPILYKGAYLSLAVDAEGFAHFTTPFLNYWTNRSGAWVLTVIDDDATFENDLALDADGFAHICFGDERQASYWLGYATNISGTWEAPTVFVSGDMAGLGCKISLDAAGRAHIFHEGNAIADFMYYTTNKTGPWTTGAIDYDSENAGFHAWETRTDSSGAPACRLQPLLGRCLRLSRQPEIRGRGRGRRLRGHLGSARRRRGSCARRPGAAPRRIHRRRPSPCNQRGRFVGLFRHTRARTDGLSGVAGRGAGRQSSRQLCRRAKPALRAFRPGEGGRRNSSMRRRCTGRR